MAIPYPPWPAATVIWDGVDGGSTQEPSGGDWDAAASRLIANDDGGNGGSRGRLYSMDINGANRKWCDIGDNSTARDLEDCVIVGSNLYVLQEGGGGTGDPRIYEVSLASIHAAANGGFAPILRTWNLNGIVPHSGGSAQEGLCFMPVAGRSMGGLFYVATQADGKVYSVELSGSAGSESVALIGSGGPYVSDNGDPNPQLNQADIGGLCADTQRRYIICVYDNRNLLVFVRINLDGTFGSVLASIAEPAGQAYEGVTIKSPGKIILFNDQGPIHEYAGWEGPDETPPVVTIATPTAGATYSTGAATISLGGEATDNGGEIPVITWENQSTGQSGTGFGGLPDFSANNIPLQVGENIIVIKATDEYFNVGTDTLTVTRTAPPASTRSQLVIVMGNGH